MTAGAVALIALAVLVLVVLSRTIRIVPQARAGVIERLGRYQRTLDPGLALIVPFVDRPRPLLVASVWAMATFSVSRASSGAALTVSPASITNVDPTSSSE